jgi:hypothetical protein
MADPTEEEVEFQYRETVELTTPYTKKKVVLYGYLTGDQDEEINDILMEDVETVEGDKGQENIKFTIKSMKAAGKRAIQMLVKSVEGKEEGAFEAVRSLPGPDYNFVCDEVARIRKGSSLHPKAS